MATPEATREPAPRTPATIDMRVVEIAPLVAVSPVATVTHAAAAARHTLPQNAASGHAHGRAAPQSAPRSPGATQARVLSQPLPVLPDDLREQGYQVTAVARFTVHADGSFEVALVKPTHNPRLNQILLDTLRRWRFFPAMENGHPVDSDQDVRVHFSVT